MQELEFFSKLCFMGLFTATTKAPARKNIFISYRVNDTAGETGRLVDSLKQHFYEDQIFMDIEKIEPGVDFTEAISRSLESCDVLLAIIGPNWQGFNAATNTSRINNSNDWVRLEISTALKRNIRVVPVLVDGAELPAAEQLPEDLQPLLRRQAYEISNKRWKYDTEELMRFLIKSVGIPPKTYTSAPVKQEKSWWTKNYPWVIIGAIVFLLLAIVGANQEGATEVSQKKEPIINTNSTTPYNPDPVSKTPFSVDGIWYDASGLYYLVLAQNGNSLTITCYSIAGQQTGYGNGSINNSQVKMDMNMSGYNFNMQTTLSENGLSLTGTSKYEMNGTSLTEPVHYTRNAN